MESRPEAAQVPGGGRIPGVDDGESWFKWFKYGLNGQIWVKYGLNMG